MNATQTPTTPIPTLPDNCTCPRGPLCRLASLEISSYGPDDGETGCQHDGPGSCLHITHEICPACMVAGYEDQDDFCAGCGHIVAAGQAEHDGGVFTDFDGSLASWGDGAPFHPLCLALHRERERQQAIARYADDDRGDDPTDALADASHDGHISCTPEGCVLR